MLQEEGEVGGVVEVEVADTHLTMDGRNGYVATELFQSVQVSSKI